MIFYILRHASTTYEIGRWIDIDDFISRSFIFHVEDFGSLM
jgi:hypothetical protein